MTALFHDTRGVRLVDQGEQKVFQRGQFMAAGIGQGKSAMDGLFERRRK